MGAGAQRWWWAPEERYRRETDRALPVRNDDPIEIDLGGGRRATYYGVISYSAPGFDDKWKRLWT